MNDLYDQIRPADEPLDEITSARIWNQITGARHVEVAEEASPADDDVAATSQHGNDEPGRRRFVPWAAAAAVVVGLVATAAAVTARTDSEPASTAAPDDGIENGNTPVRDAGATDTPANEIPAPDAETQLPAATDVVADASITGPGDLSDGTRFALADNTPDGWSVDHLEAVDSGPYFGGQQWAVLTDDGDVAGVIHVRPPRPLRTDEAQDAIDDPDTTVRGFPASEWSDGPANGGLEQRSGLTWVEDSFQMQVTGTGSAQTLVRPVAEALVIDEQARSVAIPDDLALTPADDLDIIEPEAVTTTIGISPPWSIGRGVSIRTAPNTFGYELERLIGSNLDWQPDRIDDQDVRLVRSPDNNLLAVTWLVDDMHINVSTTLELSDDDMFDIVRGIRLTNFSEFTDARNALAERTNADIATWTIHDETALADGLRITIRSRPDSDGANAICVENPTPQCALNMSDGGIADGFESSGAVGFDLGDRKVGIVWISDTVDSQTGEPTLRASDYLNPADGYADETTATVLADTATGAGRFVVVDIPDGERPPTIRFAADDATSGPIYELTPTIQSRVVK